MLVCADVRRVTSLRHDSRLRPDSTVGIQLLTAVRLVIRLALLAIQARVALSSYTDSLSDLDQSDLGTDSQRCAYDLCFLLGTLLCKAYTTFDND